MICSRSVQLRGQRTLTNEYNSSVVDREWPLVSVVSSLWCLSLSGYWTRWQGLWVIIITPQWPLGTDSNWPLDKLVTCARELMPQPSVSKPRRMPVEFLHTGMHNDKEYYHTMLNRMRQLESSLERGTMAWLLFSCVMTFSCPETAEE